MAEILSPGPGGDGEDHEDQVLGGRGCGGDGSLQETRAEEKVITEGAACTAAAPDKRLRWEGSLVFLLARLLLLKIILMPTIL